MIHHSFYCSVLLYTTILVVLSAVSSSESLSWPPEHHIITMTGILILSKINIYHCSSARCSIIEADEAQLFSASATKTICTVIASSWKAPGDTICKMAGKYHKIFLVHNFLPFAYMKPSTKVISLPKWLNTCVMILLQDSIWDSVRLFRRFLNKDEGTSHHIFKLKTSYTILDQQITIRDVSSTAQ